MNKAEITLSPFADYIAKKVDDLKKYSLNPDANERSIKLRNDEIASLTHTYNKCEKKYYNEDVGQFKYLITLKLIDSVIIETMKTDSEIKGCYVTIHFNKIPGKPDKYIHVEIHLNDGIYTN